MINLVAITVSSFTFDPQLCFKLVYCMQGYDELGGRTSFVIYCHTDSSDQHPGGGGGTRRKIG